MYNNDYRAIMDEDSLSELTRADLYFPSLPDEVFFPPLPEENPIEKMLVEAGIISEDEDELTEAAAAVIAHNSHKEKVRMGRVADRQKKARLKNTVFGPAYMGHPSRCGHGYRRPSTSAKKMEKRPAEKWDHASELKLMAEYEEEVALESAEDIFDEVCDTAYESDYGYDYGYEYEYPEYHALAPVTPTVVTVLYTVECNVSSDGIGMQTRIVGVFTDSELPAAKMAVMATQPYARLMEKRVTIDEMDIRSLIGTRDW